MSTYPSNMAKPKQIRSALRIYQVLAVIAGIALFVLLAAMFVRYGPPKDDGFSRIWSPIHGFLYMGYAASIANLGIKTRWPLKKIVLNLLTGFVPVLPWIAERRVTAETNALLQRAYFAGGPSTDDAASSRPAGGPSTTS